MFSNVFLAQTRREMTESSSHRIAYMALHFSPYANGLSNIPAELPKGSLLLLDDSMPPENHDPRIVTEQLTELVNRVAPAGVLLDFQRPATQALKAMAAGIARVLPCPVGVTETYATDLGCPVFLPPPPVNRALEEYLKPWRKQGIYLEIAPECVTVTVTNSGSNTVPGPIVQGLPLEDKMLHCHYNVEVFPDRAVFTMCRYREDLASLVRKAETMGVLGCVGLYAELQNI